MATAQPVQLLTVLEHVVAAATLEDLARTGWDVTLLAADADGVVRAHAVRGVPVVGVRGGLGGAIKGTRPDTRRSPSS